MYIINRELNAIYQLSREHNLKLNTDKLAVVVYGGERVKEIEEDSTYSGAENTKSKFDQIAWTEVVPFKQTCLT